MVKRKREHGDSELKDASQCPANMAAISSIGLQIPAPPIFGSAETELRTIMDDFVTVYERLDQEDDVNVKPNYSYTEMVYLAILRSPNFCLPIAEIYKYIKSRFTFFRNSTRKHWCNAVRHSLSKTKCFTKIAVGRGSSGNNNLNRSTYLWCIVPGSIVNFARGDYRPNVDTESGTNTLRWGYFRVNAGKFWDQVAVYLEKKMEVFQQMIMTTPSPGKVLEAQACYIPGCSKSPQQQSTVSREMPIENQYNAVTRQPTHTVHYGPKPSLSDSVITENSYTDSPKVGGNASRDSGNASLSDSSPEEKRKKLTDSGYGQESSFLSGNSCILDSTRKTPDLPDLGHVSPLSISPSISPVGNISYEGDSFSVSSFSSILPAVPSFASTPVITSLSQQRNSQPLSYYSHSMSPPLFPSLSSPAYPISSLNSASAGHSVPSVSSQGIFYPPCLPSTSISMPFPYLASTMTNQVAASSNMYYQRGPQTTFVKPHQSGSFDFGTYPTTFIPHQIPYHCDLLYQTNMASTENAFYPGNSYYPLGSQNATSTVDWSAM